MTAATTLYRYYDAAGALLYVGISKHAIQRLAQHEANKQWQAEIANVRIEHFPDRAAAHAAERAAINTENPAHNLLRYTPPPAPLQGKPRKARAKISPAAYNARCLAALTSIYEEMHWTDFIGKFRDGYCVTLVFKRTGRLEAVTANWLKDGVYHFEYGGRAATGSYTLGTDHIAISMVLERCDGEEIRTYELERHDALHEAICVDAPLSMSGELHQLLAGEQFFP
jgi:predicted GIY-YIG superfamily endonuclease